MSKTPSRAPFVEKRKMPGTLTKATREASQTSAELVTENKVIEADSMDTSVETKNLQCVSIMDNVMSAVQHEDVEPAFEELGTMIVHEHTALIEQPIAMEEIRIESAAAPDVSVPIEHESEGELLDAAETVKKSTPVKKAPAQRKTNRRKRKPVTMPKPRRKALAKTQIEVDPVREQTEDDPVEKQIEKAPAKTRAKKEPTKTQVKGVVKNTVNAPEKPIQRDAVTDGKPAAGLRKSTRGALPSSTKVAEEVPVEHEITKQLKASKKAGLQKPAALVEAEKVKQSNKRKAAEEEIVTAVQPTKRKKVEKSAEELPDEFTNIHQPRRKRTEPAAGHSPATRSRPALPSGRHSNATIDIEESSTPGEVALMLMPRKISVADARIARIRAGRRKMWRDESSSNSNTDALFDTVVSPAKSILSQRDSNTLTPSPAKARQPLMKQKVILSTTRGDRADKENARYSR